jgi:hypothetical protein
MDDMDYDERGGCLGLQHRSGLGVFKAEHPAGRSASQPSSHAAGFDIRPVMMDDAEDVPSQCGACLDLLHPAETSASRTSSASGFDTHAVVVMDANHAERVGCRASGLSRSPVPRRPGQPTSNEEETLEHLFQITCPFANECWDSVCPQRRQRNFPLIDSIRDIKDKLQVPFSMEIIILASWSIWIVRNNKIFNNQRPRFTSWKANFHEELRMLKHRMKNKYREQYISWLEEIT